MYAMQEICSERMKDDSALVIGTYCFHPRIASFVEVVEAADAINSPDEGNPNSIQEHQPIQYVGRVLCCLID